ncbi:hypothetical protein GCM10009765_08170 [Fodinicola feengrottensis]|uniref:Uncharacterized protein n=1 Tax=Fodinicola feengrottensis TaxID=435914 RepID=A0ABN2FWN1_9ACTN
MYIPADFATTRRRPAFDVEASVGGKAAFDVPGRVGDRGFRGADSPVQYGGAGVAGGAVVDGKLSVVVRNRRSGANMDKYR